jgi:flagellar motor switch/type III secretory pathway protein FliN
MKDPDEAPTRLPASTPAVSAEESPQPGAAVLAEAPVEVVAELGRISLRGDELLGLIRGSVLSIGPRRPEVVTLRVAGRPWATGELVTLDDQLGVRILELCRQP